ncbi:MAG: ATP-binding protein [Acidimicrobiia bacterium]|nr:ATP-binding protein [Acidimicrobiia bacterium]
MTVGWEAPPLRAGAVGIAYRGPDRRARVIRPARTRRWLVTSAVLLVGAWSGMVLLGLLERVPTGRLDQALLGVESAVVALAFVLAASCLAWGRVLGRRRIARLGGAVLLVALGAAVGAGVQATGRADLAEQARAASVVGATVALVRARRGPEVDSRGRLGRVLLLDLAVGASAGAVVLVAGLPLAAAALPCAALAALEGIRAARRSELDAAWVAVLFLALVLSMLAVGLPIGRDDAMRTLTGQVAVLLGMLTALVGVGREMHEAFASRRPDPPATAIGAGSTPSGTEELAHELRSSLAAIRGAVRSMGTGPDTGRDDLAGALGAEVERLLALLEGAGSVRPSRAFGVAEILGPVVAVFRAGGTEVGLDVDPEVAAVGLPDHTVEIVQALLDNATLHAPGSPVRIRACIDQGWVVLRVEDRGPGVPRGERDLVFERGRRGCGARPGGSGLGLYVARSLARVQGGDLWVEPRPGGGASFALSLRAGARGPRPAPAPGGSRPAGAEAAAVPPRRHRLVEDCRP